jgi:polyisoprenoid-binding protein YceI
MKNLAWIFLLSASSVYAQTWTPPAEVSSETVKINFEVDSTWHLIEGDVPKVSGRIWLESKSDPTSIRGELKAEVAAFDTDNGSRDKELRHVMDAEKFPVVMMAITGFEGEPCSPIKVEKAGECRGVLKSKITIRDVSKDVHLPYVIKQDEGNYDVKGDFSLQWAEFGVEDPSILVAKLDETVKIKYSLKMLRVF